MTDNQTTTQSQSDKIQGKSVDVVEDKSGDAATTQSAATSKTTTPEASTTSASTTATKQAPATASQSTTDTKATPDQQTKDVNTTSYKVKTIQTSEFKNAEIPSTDLNSSQITAKTSGSVNGDTLGIDPQSLTNDEGNADSTKNIAGSKATAKAASDTKTTDPNATDPAVKKTNITLYNGVGGAGVLTDKDKFKDGSNLSIGVEHDFGIKGDFDLDAASVKKGNKIKLLTIHAQSVNPAVSNESKSDMVQLSNTSGRNSFKVTDSNGDIIGNFAPQGGDYSHADFVLDVTTDKTYSGTVKASINAPLLFQMDNANATDYSKMHGVTVDKPIQTTLYANDQEIAHINLTKTPVEPVKIEDSGWVARDTANNNGDIPFLTAMQPFYKVQSQKERLENIQSVVKDPNGQIPHGEVQNYRAVYQLTGSDVPDTWKEAGFSTTYSSGINLFNKDDQYTGQHKFIGYSNNNGKGDSVSNVKQAADNLTPRQIYDQTQADQTLISHTGPHTWLISINMTPRTINKDSAVDQIKKSYLYNIDAENDAQQKAIMDNTINNYLGNANKGYLQYINFALNYNHLGTTDNPGHATATDETPDRIADLISRKTMSTDFRRASGTANGTTIQKYNDTYEFWYGDDKTGTMIGTPVTNNGEPNATGTLSLTVPKGYVLVKDQPELVNGQLPTKYTIGNSDQIHKIYVTKEANQKASLTVIDDTANKTLYTKNWTGSANDKVTYDPTSDITNNLKNGNYTIVKDTSTYPQGNSFTFDDNDKVDQNFVIHLTHKTKDVTDSQHPVNITETIHYVYGDTKQPAAEDHIATKPFVKTDTTDLVTNKVIKTVWTPEKDSFAAVTSPTVKGYTPDKTSIPVQNITKDSNPLVFTVTYNPDMQLAHVNYIDDNTKKSIGNDDLTGRSRQTSKYTTANRISEFENQGYELVSDGVPKTGIVFDNDDATDQNYEVHFKHGVDTKVDKNAKTVKETIHYVLPDGKTPAHPDTTATKNFDHTVKTDKVTKKVISDTWTPDQTFTEVKVPTVPGYTPNKTKIPAQTVNHGSKDIEETVNYTANPQTAKITYIDDTEKGKILDVDNADGKFGDPIKFTVPDVATEISQWEKLGYKLKSNNYDLKKAPTYQADNSKNAFEVHFVHGTSDKDKNGKTLENHKIVNETIHYVYSDGSKAHDDSKSSKAFIQTGTRDLVTNNVTYGDWNPATDSFAAVKSPTISGYTPDKASVSAQTVKPDSKDIVETVTYTKSTPSDNTPSGTTPDVPTTPTTPTTTPSNTTTPSGTTPSGTTPSGTTPTTTPTSTTPSDTTPTTPATPTDNQTTTPTTTPTSDEPTPAPVQPETPTDTTGDNGYTGGSDVDVPTGNNGGYSNGGYTGNNGNGSNLVDNNQGGSGSARTTYTSASGSDDVTARPLSTKEVAADDNNDNATSGESAASNKKSNSEAANESDLPQTGADDNLAAKAFGLAMIAATGMVGGLWFRKRKD